MLVTWTRVRLHFRGGERDRFKLSLKEELQTVVIVRMWCLRERVRNHSKSSLATG